MNNTVRKPRTPWMLVFVIAGILCLLAVLGAAGWLWLRNSSSLFLRKQQLFKGVEYHQERRQTPHLMTLYFVMVDLRQDGLSFLITPGNPKSELPLKARTTSQFLREFNLQVAINGDGFTPWRSNSVFDYYPKSGDPIRSNGLAASRGEIYSSTADQFPVLYISRTNQARFNSPIGKVYNAISGNLLLVEQGRLAVSEVGQPEPRTAVGLDKQGKKLIILVVDGRQPGRSDGATLAELGKILIKAGAFTAMNLDGGGSTTLVIEGANGSPIVLNSPIDNLIPGRERSVGNHLGIFAKHK